MSRAAERQRVLLQHLRPGAPAGVQVRGDGRGARAASGTNGDRAPRRSLLLGRLPTSHSRQAAGVCVAAWGPATRGPAWRAARGDPQKMLRWRWASETAHRGGGAAPRPAPPPARVCLEGASVLVPGGGRAGVKGRVGGGGPPRHTAAARPSSRSALVPSGRPHRRRRLRPLLPPRARHGRRRHRVGVAHAHHQGERGKGRRGGFLVCRRGEGGGPSHHASFPPILPSPLRPSAAASRTRRPTTCWRRSSRPPCSGRGWSPR